MPRSIDHQIGSAPAPNQRQNAKAKTRQAIIKAAEQLFSKQGIEETHAEEIARRAKVGVGTIYLHFGDKNGLLREILLQAADELYRRLQQVYERPPLPPAAPPIGQVETLVGYIEERGRLAAMVLGLLASGQQPAISLLDRFVEQMRQHILDGQASQVYRRDIDASLAARAALQMDLGLLAWWAADPRRAPRDELITTLAKIHSSGLAAPDAG